VKSKRQSRADAIQKHQQQLEQILASVVADQLTVADAIKAVGLRTRGWAAPSRIRLAVQFVAEARSNV
jgi:hypothetical protein